MNTGIENKDQRESYKDIEIPRNKIIQKAGQYNDTGFDVSNAILTGLTTFIEDVGVAQALAKSRGSYKFKVYSHRTRHEQHIMNEKTVVSYKGSNHIGYGIPK